MKAVEKVIDIKKKVPKKKFWKLREFRNNTVKEAKKCLFTSDKYAKTDKKCLASNNYVKAPKTILHILSKGLKMVNWKCDELKKGKHIRCARRMKTPSKIH